MFRSSSWMLSLWIGCIVLGSAYLFGLRSHDESPAFIVGQIIMGLVGAGREIYLQKTGRVEGR